MLLISSHYCGHPASSCKLSAGEPMDIVENYENQELQFQLEFWLAFVVRDLRSVQFVEVAL